MSTQLDEELTRLDAALATAERHAKAVLSGVRALRRQAAAGVVAGLARRLEQLPASAEALRTAGASFDYDAEAAFADGSYLRELQGAAEARGLVLVEQDGRITAFPLLLKLEAAVPAVRVGRRLERQIRPGVLTAMLKRAQESSAFNAEAFLEMLFRAAVHLTRAGSRADEPPPGAVASLLDIYELLTLRPFMSVSPFTVKARRLSRSGDPGRCLARPDRARVPRRLHPPWRRCRSLRRRRSRGARSNSPARDRASA